MAAIYHGAKHEAEKLVSKAKADNCWICCGKEWFTPEEFEQLAESIIIQEGNRSNLFVGFNLADPKEGIRRRTAYIKKASVELQQFTDKVMSYYNFVGKNVKA